MENWVPHLVFSLHCISSLKILCIVFWSYLFSPPYPLRFIALYDLSMYLLLYPSVTVSVVLFALEYVLLTGSWSTIHAHILKENFFFPFQHWSVINSSLDRSGTYFSFLLLALHDRILPGLSLERSDACCELKINVSWYLQLPYCTQKILFTCSYLSVWLLQDFHPIICHDP